MARALRIQYPGAFYHVMCRGNERRHIFGDDGDRHRFVALLRESLATYKVVAHVYVMMGNHFHLVVQTMHPNLSEFMRHFNICYTGWFNYRHRRCGHLYQGRYRAVLIDADNYLLQVSRYVHLNPARQNRADRVDHHEHWRHVQAYQWSSLPGYVDEKKESRFVCYDEVLRMVGGRKAYRRFIVDGLKQEVADPFQAVRHQVILGDEEFVDRVRTDYVRGGSAREQGSYRELMTDVVSPSKVLKTVSAECGVDVEGLDSRYRAGVVRGIAAELLYEYSGLTQAEIGRLIGGVDYGAVYQLRRRLKILMQQDRDVRRQYERAEKRLGEM